MADRWNPEDADDGGWENRTAGEASDRTNEVLRRAPRPRMMRMRPAEPPPEIALKVFDRGEYVGRSPFDVGEFRDGAVVRAGVPDKYIEKIVASVDGGGAKAPPLDMDPTLYAACVSALAFRRGGKNVPVSQSNGQPAFNPWQPAPQAPQQPYPPGPPPGWQPPQGPVQYQQPRFASGQPQAVRMPCGHLSSDVAAGQGGRPVCGGCARLEALRAAIQPLALEKMDLIMGAVLEWEFQLRSDLNV